MQLASECRLCAQQSAWQLPLCSRCDADLAAAPKLFEFEELTVLSLYPYTYPLDQVILQFKAGNLEWQQLLRYLLNKALRDMRQQQDDLLQSLDRFMGGSGCAVAPVPLANKRLASRGYNQSQLLAGMLQKPICNALRRVVDTPHQQGLNRSERLQNVLGAFAVDGDLPLKLLLVDDVLTTGATLRSLSQTVGQNKPKTKIQALTFCYAEL